MGLVVGGGWIMAVSLFLGRRAKGIHRSFRLSLRASRHVTSAGCGTRDTGDNQCFPIQEALPHRRIK